MGPDVAMGRIDATTVVATVEDMQHVRDGANKQFPGDTMGTLHSASCPDSAVALTIACASPLPAFVDSSLIYECPKPLFERSEASSAYASTACCDARQQLPVFRRSFVHTAWHPWSIGAFTETIVEGVSGYRFRTLQQGVEAVEKAALLDRQTIRAYALGRYSLEAVAPRFESWFDQLLSLWQDGWYQLVHQARSADLPGD